MPQANTAKRDRLRKHWSTDPLSNTGTGNKKPRRKKVELVKKSNTRKPIIWEEPDKDYLIIIKPKNGNYGNPRKKKTKIIVGEIYSRKNNEDNYVTGSTKKEVKKKLKKHPLVPKNLSINDKTTYF